MASSNRQHDQLQNLLKQILSMLPSMTLEQIHHYNKTIQITNEAIRKELLKRIQT